MSTQITREWLLMHYAAGSLRPYESLLVATYLAIDNGARAHVSRYEAEGGRMIEQEQPADVSDECLQKILGAIGLQPAKPAEKKAHRHCDQSLAIPEPLQSILARHCHSLPSCWAKLTGGVQRIDIRLCHSEPRKRHLRLVRMQPGQSTPPHRHAGTEITLVLEGGYSDTSGHYRRGDIVIVEDAQFVHAPRADDDGCLCLMLTEAPLRFSHPLEQFFNVFRRL